MSSYTQLLGDTMQWGETDARYQQLAPAVAACLNDSECNTENRVSMWCAQVGHESLGLYYMEEIADGSAYEGREDLGNIYPGDGCRFKGRGPIMVTGRYNYTECSEWAYSKGLVPSPTYFVDYPEEMASDIHGFIGTTWYWTTQRPMNEAADAGDIELATYYINGGYTNLEDREQRWNMCLAMGQRIMGLTDEEAATEGQVALVGEKVLNYDHNIVGQETGYNCGPASAQVTLSCRGIYVPESQLAAECGTDQDGTDYVGLIENCLDPRLPEANYTSVDAPNDPPTQDQKNRLWDGVLRSINSGYAIVMNWVVPGSNRPVGIKGTASPNYGNYTTYHYVTCVGYDDNPAQRAIAVADSGFQPPFYWITLDQCATLIPPKAACYANLPHAETPGEPVTETDKLNYEQLCGPVDPNTGYGTGWAQLGQNSQGQNLYVVDALSDILHLLEGGKVQDHQHLTAAAAATLDYESLTNDQLAGPKGTGWAQLGGRTVTDAIAHIKNVIGGGDVPFRQTPETGEHQPSDTPSSPVAGHGQLRASVTPQT